MGSFQPTLFLSPHWWRGIGMDNGNICRHFFVKDRSYNWCFKHKDYVNNGDQFTRKTAIPQDTFLDTVNHISTFNNHLLHFLSLRFTNNWRCSGKTSIFNHSRDLYAGSRRHWNIYGTISFKSLKTICRWRFFIPFLNVRTWKMFSITTMFTKTLSLPWSKKVMED